MALPNLRIRLALYKQGGMMKTIEMTVIVDESKKLILQLPDGISPGLHQVVLVIDEQAHANDSIASENIDAAFAEMVNDSEYQTEAIQIESEFAVAQWEALQIALDLEKYSP